MRLIYSLILALAAGGLLAAADQAPVAACNVVPGWSQTGPDRSYVADNLFEYMDGNAEGYLTYGFLKMQGVTCKKGDVTFVVDLSDFGDADSAYGMFTSNVDGRQPTQKIGMQGQIVPRRAFFAKGRYFLEIAANPEGDYTPALKEWTAAFDKLIPGNTELPAALTWFPTEQRQSLRLVPQSVFGIRALKRGYAAQYDYGKAFVVQEATPQSAGAVMDALRKRFGNTTPASVADEAFQVTDQYLGRLCIFRKGQFIGGYAISQDGVDPIALAKNLAGKVTN
ncbi:MAG: DUF6599 family protein [Bryobacteraceae bacterium]|jgi:hypothetical protein